jgi:hypothetical protein
MTIFGFNTDVKSGNTVYHVQTEARVSDLVVQTLVFVKGLCVGKRTTSYAQEAAKAGFSDQVIHELLKTQHRTVVDSITAGRMESALGKVGEVQDIGSSGLSLKWIKADAIGPQHAIVLHFQVTDGGSPVAGAQLLARLASAANAPVIARTTSDSSGNAEMHLAPTEELRRDPAIMVQATHAGKSATRKFRLKMTSTTEQQRHGEQTKH